MFILYYVWGFFFYIVSISHVFIEKNFLIENNPYLIRKRTFKFISYFEKLFLAFFYKKGWFEDSIANLYRKKDIIDYRRKNFPLINIFYLYVDKMDYKICDLKLLVKQFKFYSKSKSFKLSLNRVFRRCFKNKNRKFLKFLIIQKLFFNKYYNSYSYPYFKTYNNLNTLKLNLTFNLFLMNAKGKLVIFDLDKWHDWYAYCFSKKIKKYYKGEKLTRQQKIKWKQFRLNKIFKWINIVFKYKKRYVHLCKILGKHFAGIIFVKFNITNVFKIDIRRKFHKLLKNYYTIRFAETSVTKHINANNLKNFNISFLRKNRIFNKGRYSRNRQLYRTGVYWCLWLNIIMVYGLYFMFYRFSFNFGYIWWGILILAYSTIFSRIVKYNFYNAFYLYKEFIKIQRWYGYIIKNIIFYLETMFIKYLKDVNVINYIAKFKNDNFSIYFDNYYLYISKMFFYWMKKKKNIKLTYLWQGMKLKDTSFLRYKTVIHWVKEIYRLFTTW